MGAARSLTDGCSVEGAFEVAGGQLLLTVVVGVTGAFLVGKGLLQFSSETTVDLEVGVEGGANSSS